MDIVIEGLGYRYPSGIDALDGIDLRVPGGSSLAIIGANGSGKSTLARHLNGLLRPSRGRVLIGEQDTASSHVARLARLVGIAFQDPDRQIFERSVRSEVEFGPRQRAVDTGRWLELIDGCLERVGLLSDAETHPQDLSEAGRKLLSIASVLAMETPVLVLDEPTVGLDAPAVERVASLIDELHREGRSVIAVSHDMRFVAETFERVVLMDGGRIVGDGAPSEIFAEAAWPRLTASGLRPPPAAALGAELGLGSTPTEASFAEALERRSPTSEARPADRIPDGGRDSVSRGT